MSALEKIVMVGRGPPPPKVEGEGEGEEGPGEEAFSVRSEEEVSDIPLGVQLLEYEQEKERAKVKSKSASRVPPSLPFNATSTRSFEKKVKAHIEKVDAEVWMKSAKPEEGRGVPMFKAVEEINNISLTLNELKRELTVDREDLTTTKILEEALEDRFPEELLETLAVVPESHSLREESGEDMMRHWKAFEIVDSVMDQEIQELGKLSAQHSKLMKKVHLRVNKLNSICRGKMESMQRSLQSHRRKNESLQEQIDYLTKKLDYFTEVVSSGSRDRKKLEKELGSSNKALSERNLNSSNLMARYFAEKTILTSELSIYKQQIMSLKADRENAVLSATKSLSSDLTVALSEWESMEQKLLILEHQVKKAQADSSDSLVRLHKNATVQTEVVNGKDLSASSLESSSSSDIVSANSSETDIIADTTLGSWELMYVSVGQNQSLQWVLSTIAALYNDAIRDSKFIRFSRQGTGYTFKDFVRRWHFTRYGLPYVAETNLADLIISVHRIARSNKHVRMFAYFCGIWDYRAKIYNEQIVFVMYTMQCLSRSKDVSCLFPEEGSFWVKPLEVYDVINEIFNTMRSDENARTFMANHVERLLDPIMDMYKSEDILFAMQSEWERQRNKMCAKLEAYYNFSVPEGQSMLAYDEFAMILGKVTHKPRPQVVTAVYDECRSLCIETKEMTLDIVQKAILKYGIGLWKLDVFPEISPPKLNDQSYSKNKMPRKTTGNPLFNILDHVLKSKLFDMSVADADELKVKLGIQSTIVKKFVETYDALIREYKDRVDAEQAWKLYRLFISQVNSGRKSNGYFWTRIGEMTHSHFWRGTEEPTSLDGEDSLLLSSSDDVSQDMGSPSIRPTRSPGSEVPSIVHSKDSSPNPGGKAGSSYTADFLVGNF